MTATNEAQEIPQEILRRVKKLDDGKYETIVSLIKGKGDYLQGYIKVNGEKRHVVAHLNQRKPDTETGEQRPNFISLSEAHHVGDDTIWKNIGFGNAINKRQDGQPVYFDEVLFSVESNLVDARLTKNIDDDMHNKLGFLESRKERPKFEARNTANTDPKPTAQVANIHEENATCASEQAVRRNAPTPA